MDYPAAPVLAALTELGVTHVVWLPDSAIGPWETALERSAIRLVRVAREGEAWAIAAGLYLGGKQPLVMIQNTGLFESGDAMRNVLFDLGLPLWAVIGYRSALIPGSTDSARFFTEPVLQAWGLRYLSITSPADFAALAPHFKARRDDDLPAIALVAEGRM